MSASISSVKRIKQAIANVNDHARFVTIYVTTGILVILVPALHYAVTMAKYRHSYYYAYQQQEAGNGSGDMDDVNNCKWFNPWCTSTWVNGNGEYMNEDEIAEIPSWFSGWSAGGANERNADNTSNTGAVKFVYSWQLLMFLGLLAYGSLTIYKYRGNLAQSRVALNSLSLLIFIFGNFSFLSMWLLANGSILTGARELEEIGGFNHQFSVMVFITNFWYCIWCIGACIAVARRVSKVQSESSTEDDEMAYLPYSDTTKPEITATTV